MQTITCKILTVGNELLIGETVDTNSAAISRHLTACGVTVIRKESLPDDVSIIAEAIKTCGEDILIITGGLGPTPDDMTREGLAQAFSVRMRKDPHQVLRIKGFFKKFRRKPVSCNFVQAMVPEGFRAIDNPFGTAPVVFKADPFVIALPGVPRELEGLMPKVVIPLIRKKFTCPDLCIEEIKTTGIGESMLFDRIKNIKIPQGVTFASLPETSGVTLRLMGKERKIVRRIAERMRTRARGFVYGRRDDTLENAVHRLFIQKKLTLALAESCTGGLASSRLVSVPGSSNYFLGGVVSYSNMLKEKLLNVPAEILSVHGAVSAETALFMARGVVEATGADIGASITGIAGPDGGTADKPVGTVYAAVVSPKGETVERFNFFGGRKGVQERSTAAVQFMIIKAVERISGKK